MPYFGNNSELMLVKNFNFTGGHVHEEVEMQSSVYIVNVIYVRLVIMVHFDRAMNI